MSTTNHIDLFREVFPDKFDGKPARIQVFKVGKWAHPTYGDISITPDDLQTIVKNYETTKRAVVLDYDHGTDTGEAPEDRKAAGWLKDLRVEDDGLWGDFSLTDEASEYVQKGEYRFFSPTWVSNFANKETGEEQGMTLLRGALTNNPFIDGMHPAVALSEKAAEVIAATEKHEPPVKEEVPKQEVRIVTKGGRSVWLCEPGTGGLTLKTEVVDV